MRDSGSASIIGYGGMGREHEAAYLAENIRISHKLYKDDWPEALKAEGRYVSICSYDDAHAEQAVAVLKEGKIVIIEKPICQTAEELYAIASLATEKTLTCNFPIRFGESFIAMKNRLVSPYHLEFDYNWGRASRYGWRTTCQNYSIATGAGIHMIDAAIWLLGGRPKSVVSVGDGMFLSVLVEFESGQTGRMNVNCGFDGVHEHRISAWSDNGEDRVSNTKSLDKRAAIRRFIQSVKNDTRPCIPLKDIYDGMCVAIAIKEAVRSRQRVKVQYL